MISVGNSLRGPAVQRCFLVPALRHKAFEHFALVIDGAPEIVFHGVDLHENLVEMPAPMSESSHCLDPAAPDLRRENRPEAVPLEHDVFRRKHIMLLSYYYRVLFCEKPDSTFSQHALEPHRLMRDVDAALMQQVFHIPQRQRVAHLHHHREAHDLGARFEGAENAGVAHVVRLAALPDSKPIFL